MQNRPRLVMIKPIKEQTMDHLYIRDLKIPTVIGTYAWERQIKQTVVLNLEIGIDAARVANANDLSAGVDYAAAAEAVIEFVAKSEFLLLEALAEAITNLLFERFQVAWVKLDLAKPGAVNHAKAVGVVIERKMC